MSPHHLEMSRASGPCRRRPAPLRLALALALAFATLHGTALAQLPTGAKVVSGSASITAEGSTMAIRNSPNAILDWQSFSIGAGNQVQFNQADSTSQVLNRVVGEDASRILGNLSSNGRVWLINPNGVLFGPGARVELAGLVASTLNVTNADFLSGSGMASADPARAAAAVVNQGEILLSSGGRAWLLGGTVRNEGLIQAPDGQILLAAGTSLEFVDAAAPNVLLRVSAPANEALNLGRLLASGPGGGIEMLGGIVNQQGIVRADSTGQDAAGRVVLRAQADLMLGGKSMTSTSTQDGGAGGPTAAPGQAPGEPSQIEPGRHGIELNGTRIVLEPGAVISSTASGDAIVLRGSSFDNQAGAAVLNAPNGRWLVQTDGVSSTQLGGLPHEFVLFNAADTASPGYRGNGLLYRESLDLLGSVSRIYDGTAVASLGLSTLVSAAPAGYQAKVVEAGVGSFNDRNVGSGKPIIPIAEPVLEVKDGAGKPVYGYSTSYQGEILPVPVVMDASIETAVRLAQPPSDAFAAPGLLDLSALGRGQVFAPVNVGAMSQGDLAGLLESRREFKRKLFADSISRLEIDPSLADVKPCTSAEEAGSGNCRITPEQVRQAHAAGQAQPAAPRQAALPQIERKIAVLFGINDYLDRRIPRLESAIPDVDAVARVLSASMGYEVRVLRNPGKADILRTLNQLSTEVTPSDSVLVYYAGHGYSLERQGAGYWIASDAPADDPRRWLSNHDIARLLAAYPSRQLALVSDSCYSGAFAREAIDVAARPIDAREVLGKRSVVVLTSGGDEPVTDEGKDGHSIFAWNLMQSLSSLQGWTPGNAIFRQVQSGVTREFPQTPRYGAVTEAGHQQGGEYLFEVR